MITCPKCGMEYTAPQWPWCPHGVVGEKGFAAQPDTYPNGPIRVSNYGREEMEFTCESERLAYMKKEGLTQRERWVPLPGTDHDPMGIQNPNGYQDPVTLANGAALMLRAAGVPFDGVRDGVLRGLEVRTVESREEMTHALGQELPRD
jgi:hypothetical protein